MFKGVYIEEYFLGRIGGDPAPTTGPYRPTSSEVATSLMESKAKARSVAIAVWNCPGNGGRYGLMPPPRVGLVFLPLRYLATL